jgi:hypothetical protein
MIKIVPGDRFAVLLAASKTAVIVGEGGPVVPPEMVMVPEPVRVNEPVLVPLPLPAPEAVTLLKVPVAPAKPPVPLAMAMDPVPLALDDDANSISASSVAEAVKVPVSVPVVLPLVTVTVIGMVPVPAWANVKLELNVPEAVRSPVKATFPVAEPPVAEIDPVPLIVMVVLSVAACAPAHSKVITASTPHDVFME